MSQDAWVRACLAALSDLAGQPEEALSFHPFCRHWSARPQADCIAATVFADKALLQPFYQNAHDDPEGLIAGILAVRLDLLLAWQFAGVATNISDALQNLPLKQFTLAQVVYAQLWGCAYSTPGLLLGELPLNKEQCDKLLLLFDKPAELADYLSEFSTFETQSLPKKEQSFDETIEGDIVATEPSENELGDLELEQDAKEQQSSLQQGAEHSEVGSNLPYQIYTQDHDRLVNAASLAPEFNYSMLKQQFTQQLPEFASLSRRLANKLRRHLLSLKKSAWQDDLEEGYLNNAKLAAMVASPIEARPFRQLIDEPLPQSAVTLLIDCSGSMKQQPLLMAAAWVDALVGALELCQVKVEVLGFTTGHWDVGPVQNQWKLQGGASSVGRLNDLLHVEFKSFEQPWRRVRNGLAAVLESNWQKENIDGEALSWAYQRLKARAEPKKLLFVLADAKPFDQSTLENNGSDFLEQDLINRVVEIEQDNQLELFAIGIGHRVCRVYSNSLQINQLTDLPEAMLDTLVKSFK